MTGTKAPRARFGAAPHAVLGGTSLVAEYVLTSIYVSAYAASLRGGAWSAFAYMERLGLIGVLATVCALLLGAGASKERPALVAHLRPVWLAAHLPIYGAFFVVNWLVLGRAEHPPPGPALIWVTLWFGLGFATVATLFRGLFTVSAGSAQSLVGISAAAGAIAFVAWRLGESSRGMWEAFSRCTLTGSAAILSLFSPNVSADPANSTLRLGDFEVYIARECSGLEGMGLLTVLLLVYLFAFRRELRFPNALLLLPLGVCAVWCANLLRLSALMAVGAYVSPDVADGGFHSKAGWALFCVTTLLVTTLGRKLPFFSRIARNDPSRSAAVENPTVAYLLPLLTLIASALLTGMFVKDLDRLYWVRAVATVGVLVALRRSYRALAWDWSWLSLGVGALVAIVWLAVPPPARESSTFTSFAAAVTPTWLVVRALGSTTIVPIAEELAFRGYLMRWFVSRDFDQVSLRAWTPFSILASSLAFGILHERWVVATVAGVAFALTQIRTGRLSDAMIGHAVSNGLIALWVLTTGDFAHWM